MSGCVSVSISQWYGKNKIKNKSWYLPITLKTKGVLHNIHIYYLQKRSKKFEFRRKQATARLAPANVTNETETSQKQSVSKKKKNAIH